MNTFFSFANRFVNDCNLPVAVINEEHFFYLLKLYNKEMGTLDKYNKLTKVIDSKFGSDVNKFLTYFLNVRSEIIEYFHNSELYNKTFNTIDLKEYSVPKLNVSKKNIYNEENIGKRFVSIDIKQANYQCLKYFVPDLFKGKETYEDFIGLFTDLDYIKESKYNRQVIFGQLNPSRHITLEKYLSYKIYQECEKEFQIEKLVSLTNDEIIYVIEEGYDKIDVKQLETFISERIGIIVKSEKFTLNGYSFETVRRNNGVKLFNFYVKDYGNGNKSKMYCVPLPYYALAYKLYNNIELTELDYHFNYEKLDCVFKENFRVTEIK